MYLRGCQENTHSRKFAIIREKSENLLYAYVLENILKFITLTTVKMESQLSNQH